jgi:hypothetical protein
MGIKKYKISKKKNKKNNRLIQSGGARIINMEPAARPTLAVDLAIIGNNILVLDYNNNRILEFNIIDGSLVRTISLNFIDDQSLVLNPLSMCLWNFIDATDSYDPRSPLEKEPHIIIIYTNLNKIINLNYRTGIFYQNTHKYIVFNNQHTHVNLPDCIATKQYRETGEINYSSLRTQIVSEGTYMYVHNAGNMTITVFPSKDNFDITRQQSIKYNQYDQGVYRGHVIRYLPEDMLRSPLENPSRSFMKFNSQGHIILSNSLNNCIFIINPDILDGNVLRIFRMNHSHFGNFVSPGGFDILTNSGILLADRGNHRIVVFDLQESEQMVNAILFGEEGSNIGQFQFPLLVKCSETHGKMIVVDNDCRRLQMIDTNAYPITFNNWVYQTLIPHNLDEETMIFDGHTPKKIPEGWHIAPGDDNDIEFCKLHPFQSQTIVFSDGSVCGTTIHKDPSFRGRRIPWDGALREGPDNTFFGFIENSILIRRPTDIVLREQEGQHQAQVQPQVQNVEPPDELRDMAFSTELFNDPVVASDGFTYSRSEIEEWLATHDTSPTTGKPMLDKRLIPNILVRQLVEKWRTENPGYKSDKEGGYRNKKCSQKKHSIKKRQYRKV